MHLNDIFDRIVLINLDRRPDRLAEFQEQADKIGLKFERLLCQTCANISASKLL